MDKSPTDTRLYKTLTLKNGLKVVLVSDPAATKAAAAMDVNVGSIDDPPHREGMAHFIEHLLFLGTKTYPKADDFDRFIESHHGTAPAYTDDEHTHYAFDMDPLHFQEGLQRFAEFFFAPAFNVEWIHRERLAIDAEYLQDIQQDGHRISHILYAATVNPQHPLSRFRIGKLSTLADRPKESLRDALLAFYRRYYTADRMSLAILGPGSLDELEAWCAPFEQIAALRLAPARTRKPLLSAQELKVDITIRPINHIRELSFYFAIPSQRSAYKTKPAHILAYLLAQEGPGSLFEYFRTQGLVEELHADSHALTQDQDELYISFDLTTEGVHKIEEITQVFFSYLSYLHKTNACELAYHDITKADQRNFLFQEREEELHLVSDLAFHHHFVPIQDLLTCHFVLEDNYPKEAIEALLAFLTPEYCRRVLIHKDVPTNQQDSFYHTQYQVSPLVIAPTATKVPTFMMPVSNPFLPEDFSVLPAKKANKKPAILFEESNLTVWHCADPHFKLPKVNIYFYFRNPYCNASPQEHLYLSFLQASLIDQCTYYHDRFVLAGIHYQIHKLPDGLLCCISAYSDKLPIILKTFLGLFIEHAPEEVRFEILKRQLMDAIEDTKNDLPYDLVCEDLETLLTTPDWLPLDCLAPAQDLNLEGITKYLTTFWQNCHLLTFVHGNLSKTHTMSLFQNLYPWLCQKIEAPKIPIPPENRYYRYCPLPKQSNYLWFSHTNQADSAVCLYFQAPNLDLETQALASLCAQLMGAAFFHQLRTIEQLGYAMLLNDITLGNICGIRFIVQSQEYSAFKVLERIRAFIEAFWKKLEQYSDDDLKTIQTALVTALRMPPQYLSELTDLYWHDILNRYIHFDTRERLAKSLLKIKITDIQHFYHQVLVNPETSRQLVCITKDNTIPHQKYYSQITNMSAFKDTCLKEQG